MKSAIKTIFWLLRDFTPLSAKRVLFYYLKKKKGALDYKSVFEISFRYKNKMLKFDIRENNDDFAIIREVFLFGAYKMPRINKKFKKIFDCGGHIGAPAIYFGILNPDTSLYIFEPDKNSRKILEKNLKKNKVEAKIFPWAISDKKKKSRFNSDYKNPAYSGISNNGGDIIQTVSFKDIFSKLKIKEVDLIKMDIEGEEINALKTLKKGQTNFLILETHLDKYELNDLKKVIKKSGLKIMPPLKHWKELNEEIEYPIMIGVRK